MNSNDAETTAPVQRLVHTSVWTIEPHGNGYALYSGRGPMSHGLKLVHMSEPDGNWEATKRLIEAAPELAEALRILYDFQNGPPLEKYRTQWTQAMELARSALDRAGKL